MDLSKAFDIRVKFQESLGARGSVSQARTLLAGSGCFLYFSSVLSQCNTLLRFLYSLYDIEVENVAKNDKTRSFCSLIKVGF